MYEIDCCDIPYVWEYFKCGNWNIKVIADNEHMPQYGWCSNSGSVQYRHFGTEFSFRQGGVVAPPCKCTSMTHDYLDHSVHFNYSPLASPPAGHNNTYWVNANLVADTENTSMKWNQRYYASESPCGATSYLIAKKTGVLLEWQCYETNSNPDCWTEQDWNQGKHSASFTRHAGYECSSKYKYGQYVYLSVSAGGTSQVKVYDYRGTLLETVSARNSPYVFGTANSNIYFDFL